VIDVDLHLEEGQAEDGDGSLVHVNVSVTEADGSWRNASTCLPVDNLTPDQMAEALVQCIVGVAAQRSPHTLIALQQRLLAWGQD
jgi:hypothetical protein